MKVDMAGGGAVTFAGIVTGSIQPIRPSKIYATGTDAANIVALY